jgi:hypothetical protein
VATKSDKNKGISTLTISGLEVEVIHERVPIGELRVDPDNPRIRFQIEHGGKKKPENEGELLELIRAQPGYDDLQKQIRTLGGIFDPIIVRHNGTVVEGNTRLAALTLLHIANRSDPKWKTVPITRLPVDIPEETVEMLMANFHIAGKTVWRPAAQAEHIYRLIKERNVSAQRVADETRMSKKKVEQYVEAYEYLIKEVLPEVPKNGKLDRQSILEKKFSHALEFVAGKKLQSVRDDVDSRKNVATMIANDKITGLEVRKLPELLANKKAKAVLIKDGYKAASDVHKKTDPAANSKLVKAIKGMTEMLSSMQQDEIELLRSHAKARATLSALAEIVANVQDIVTPSSSRPKSGHA